MRFRFITIMLLMPLIITGLLNAQRQMEKLDRGVVAVALNNGKVYVGWRMLGTEPDNITFNVYRDNTLVNSQPIANSTNLVDEKGRLDSIYTVRTVIDGSEGSPSKPAKVLQQNYISIPLKTPDGYTPNDASVGDLDGDGEYEIVLHQAGRGRDNSQGGKTSEPVFEAYKLNGTFLWRINLGKNIREGAHYTQFMVYDLDGDGRAEFACKTADGTVDGKGKVIGDAKANYVNERGFILSGPEFLTVFDGQTGAELVTVDYIPPRGPTINATTEEIGDLWGDGHGNRCDRFLACIAYLDGQRPSLVMCRGYYERTVLAAWNYRDGRLTNIWTFDSDDGIPDHRKYKGQGNHNLSVGDVDGDGRDEIIYGACAIDHDGKGLYTTGLGHGDAMHLSDIDPDRPGLEVFAVHERPKHSNGANLRDAATGKILWGLKLNDPGRGLAIDIDPRHKGYECWTNDSDGLYDCKGLKISDSKPDSCNMGIWWDGDIIRELLNGITISKWDYENNTTIGLFSAEGCARNNGSKSNPCLCADILGDWREELICRTTDGTELRIYTTTNPTEHRFYTFMHDPVYRLGIAWQNVAYNQPAHTGFYMGQGMVNPPRPNIKLISVKN